MKKTIILSTMLIILMSACKSDKDNKIYAENVSSIESPIIRFHKLVNGAENLDSLISQYPRLANIVYHHIIGLEKSDRSEFIEGIKSFLEDEPTQNIAALIDSIYGDISMIESDWNNSISLYHYYFPDRSIPTMYMLQSNLGVANFIFEDKNNQDAIGVSLGFFLGSAFPYVALAKENAAFSDYNTRTFNKEHLVTKSLNAIIDDMLGEVSKADFLHYMIREGKRLYLLEKLCPHISDTVIFEYTSEQLDWCRNNEYEIWNFLLESNLIYETSMMKISKYLQPAPTSKGMPGDSPGRTGAFVGYKIIKSFLKKNKGTEIEYLISLSDAQDILDRAKYKPRIQ